MYLLIKTVHVFLAITAVGFNFSYGIWTARASRDPQHAPYTLKTVLFLDRIANAAYGLLLLTGILMVVVGGLSFKTFWIAASIALYFVTVGIAAGLYTPALRRQLAIAGSSGPESPEYLALAGRARMFGILTMVPVLLIVILMVNKPTHLF
jgi:uncharacterized membrane protein